jgi:NADPH:quinone reductase-like Zn-dependent oxidoreductase
VTETERMTIARSGGPEVLELRREPLPAPGPGDVVVRVRAAGLNFADIYAREGLYGPAPPPPFVPGFEVAGEVESGTGWEPGARVFAVTRFGGYARRVVVRAERLFPVPAGWSFEEAAAFPAVYMTAFHGLANVARVRPGERVLVHSAAGGVGIAAGQLLQPLGVRGIGTVGSARKIDVARAAGYEHVIDYRACDFETAVRRLTEGEGVDVILDAIGGSFFKKGYRLLRGGGRLCCFGLAGMTPRGKRPSYARLALEYVKLPRWNPIELIDDNRQVAGFQVLRLWERLDILEPAMRRLLELAAAGTVRPTVAETFPLEKAGLAQQRLHSGETTGKLVLTC